MAEAGDVLLLSLDSCRFDTFRWARTPQLDRIGPLHRAQAPSHFTYGSHAAFWMGFTPGVSTSRTPWLNPKAGKVFRMAHGGGWNPRENPPFLLDGANLVEGFRRLGHRTLGSGAVAWFDPATPTGAVLGAPFDAFHYAGNTWSLTAQLCWIQDRMEQLMPGQACFLFLNVGETHVPYWHEGAPWAPWPSPCVPFGGPHCSAAKSRRRQKACLEWVDGRLGPILERFRHGTILACADHGDCWGEDGLWEHGVSHRATLTVPLLLRVKGIPVTSPSRIRTALARLRRFLPVPFAGSP